MRIIINLFLILGLAVFGRGVPLTSPRNASTERIIGGEVIDISQIPYQVEVLFMNLHFCGGALISDRWVLTASQCTQMASNNHVYTIRAGTNFRETGGQVRGVIKIINHHSYNSPRQYDYDISLMQISRSFDTSPLIQIISLPQVYSVLNPGDTALVSGWGYTSTQGDPTNVLHAVQIPIISTSTCRHSYGTNAITDRMICAGSPYGGRDACVDDGGGPLVVGGTLVGLVSWGYGCASANYPGVYASVINLREWIRENSGV